MKHYDLHTVCHLGGLNHSLPPVALRVIEVGEASIRGVGNGWGLRRCRVKHKNRWGPSGNDLTFTHKPELLVLPEDPIHRGDLVQGQKSAPHDGRSGRSVMLTIQIATEPGDPQHNLSQ